MSVCRTLADVAKLPETVVVIDVFRSSNTVLAVLAMGAERVVTVEGIDQARALKQANPSWLLLGERGGRRLPDTDGDNSPAQVLPDFAGATVILTTSGGTRCIEACGPEQSVYLGSFANSASLVEVLKRNAAGSDVGFWAVGVRGEEPAEEDDLCADYLDALWRGDPADFEAIRLALLSCPGADRLRRFGQEADLAFCAALDSHDVVPRRVPFDNGLWCLVNAAA